MAFILREEIHLARLNDNLFTTPGGGSEPSELGCRCLTRFGWLRVRFRESGLSDLVFDDEESSGARASSGSVFREAFLEWLAAFERLDPAGRWRYLDPAGTDFQKSVWRALLEIPFGGRTSYGRVAEQVGRPKASRAVGSAVGANPISLLIPCHRVLPSTGDPGKYRWGVGRKLALLEAEAESGSDLCGLFA